MPPRPHPASAPTGPERLRSGLVPSLATTLAVVARTPRPVVDATLAAAGVEQSWRPSRAVRQWQLNAEVVTGVAPTRAQTAAAVRSWGRNLAESCQLASWTPEDTVGRVEIDAAVADRLKRTHATTGAVLALPHLGSWDHAGAWACLNGMPVTSVAEQLAPQEFAYFERARAGVGMRIHSHRDPLVGSKLVADQREGRMVCLVTDRDLSRRGVTVRWPVAGGRRDVRMPAGAAQVALATGATLLAVTTWYHGPRLHIDISEPITAPAGPGQVASMCQQLADVFGPEVQRHVLDWHVFLPFFPGVRVPVGGRGRRR